MAASSIFSFLQNNITYNKKVDGKYFLRKHKTYLYWGAKAQTVQHYYLLALID